MECAAFTMSKSRFMFFPLIGLILISAGSARYNYALNGDASSISAKVSFLGIDSKTVRSTKLSGSLSMTPANISDIDLKVNVDATSLTSGDKTSDGYIKGKAFFDTANHSTISYVGTSLAMSSKTSGVVNGKLTIKGITRSVPLNVSFSSAPADNPGIKSVNISATTSIDRTQFGMKSYKAMIGKTVSINIKGQMLLK